MVSQRRSSSGGGATHKALTSSSVSMTPWVFTGHLSQWPLGSVEKDCQVLPKGQPHCGHLWTLDQTSEQLGAAPGRLWLWSLVKH